MTHLGFIYLHKLPLLKCLEIQSWRYSNVNTRSSFTQLFHLPVSCYWSWLDADKKVGWSVRDGDHIERRDDFTIFGLLHVHNSTHRAAATSQVSFLVTSAKHPTLAGYSWKFAIKGGSEGGGKVSPTLYVSIILMFDFSVANLLIFLSWQQKNIKYLKIFPGEHALESLGAAQPVFKLCCLLAKLSPFTFHYIFVLVTYQNWILNRARVSGSGTQLLKLLMLQNACWNLSS